VTFDGVDLSNPQEQDVAEAVSTPLHSSLTRAPPGSIPTHFVTVGPDPRASASGLSGLHILPRLVHNSSALVDIANGGPQALEPTTPSLPHSVHTVTNVHSTQLSQPLDQASQSLQTPATERTSYRNRVHTFTLASSMLACSSSLRYQAEPTCVAGRQDLASTSRHQTLDGAIPRQRLCSTYSPMSPAATCGKDSPQALAHSVVANSELTQVTDLLAMFAGVTSTTPASDSTWSTLITTPSSGTGLVVSRVVATPVPTQRLTHSLGGSAVPLRPMDEVPSVTVPQAQPHGQGLTAVALQPSLFRMIRVNMLWDWIRSTFKISQMASLKTMQDSRTLWR